MTTSKHLPRGIFKEALRTSHELQESRIRKMYNRHRALFAESIVAALLPGAAVTENPSAPWDVTWLRPRHRIPVRIQVKCSGEYLPRYPDGAAKAQWGVKPPNSGFDADTWQKLPAGHHCDVFVLARHEGRDIEGGWSFYVLSQEAG